MYQVSRLKNGLSVATAEMPHMASVSVGIWVGVGGRYEPAELNGVSHFIEHMLFKGTRRRTAAQISEAVEGVGGYLNAFTGEEHTCFYARAHHERFDEIIEVLSDMFLHSNFAPAEIAKERDVIKEELAMYLDQPQQFVHELLNQAMWPDQPLGRSITGTVKSLDALDRSRMVDYLRAKYVTNATLIAAAGNLRHEEVVKAVSRLASGFRDGKRPVFLPVTNGQEQVRVKLHTKQVEQTQLALGFQACSRHDERRHALRVLNTLLGENMSSRLWQVLREDHGLAYNIYSSPSFFDDTGDLVISAGLETGNLQKTLRLIVREVRRLIESPVAAAELRRARDYLIGQTDLSLESTENQMMWVGEQVLSYGRIYAPDLVKERIGKVTAAQVRSAARDFFRPERTCLALISPVKKAPGVEAILRGI